MSGKVVRVVVIAVVIIALGITLKPLFRPGGIFCTAEDAVEQAGVAQDPVAPDAAPEETIPPTSAPQYDFSDSSNWNLTVSAWESNAKKDFDGVFAYTKKCLELYEAKAKELAPTMRSFSRAGYEDDFAVVNDVATCHYIMGETYMKMGRTADALKEFKHVIENYPYAQCWDPKGWFWKVAEVSQKNIDKIEKSSALQQETPQ